MTKFLNVDWMYENGFITEEECVRLNSTTLVENTDWGTNYTVADLPLKESIQLKTDSSLKEAINLMEKHAQNFVPVADADGNIVGTVSSQHLMERFTKNKLTMDDSIGKFVLRDYRRVSRGIQLCELSRIFTRVQYVLVEDKFIVQHKDLLNFMLAKESNNEERKEEPEEAKTEETKENSEETVNEKSYAKMIAVAAMASSAAAAVALYASQNKN